MNAKRRQLRTQLSIAMIVTAVISLFILIAGMIIFYVYLQETWVAGLSPANRQTLETLQANGQVDPNDLVTLVNIFSLSWSGDYAGLENLAAITFVTLAVVTAIVIGIYVARRLSRQFETVTNAASQIAGGKFDIQIEPTPGASLEAQDLVQSFNHMTHALVKAERDSSESAAAIAHELRTPLTVLRGRLQGFRDGAFEPTPDMLDALVAQVDTLSNIVDELGTLSKLSAGQLELEVSQIDLAEEAKIVVTGIEPDLEREGFVIEADLQPAPVNADPARVRQALGALIENVRQYAPSGRYLSVKTYCDQNSAFLQVIDHGPGIAAGERERVFDRWWRGDSSRARAAGGSGLGLSVTLAIARAHGGFAEASAAPDHNGAMLSFVLPRS